MPLKILSSVSIKRKLVGVILATSLAVLGVTCAALLMFEIVSYRHTTAKSLSTIADIVAENSSAALMFDDRKLAEEIVSGLRVEPEISRAALFDQNTDIVATYPSDLAASEVPPPAHLGVVLHWNDVTLYKPVMQGDRRVGTVFIQGNLRGMYRRLGVYGLVLAAVMGSSVFIALVLSNYLQRSVSGPVLSLAATAARVTSEQDFSIRAAKLSDDELGALADSFNAMLDRIQAGHRALQESEERFRTLADNMAQLAWMADEVGRVRWYNKRWYDFTGATPDQAKDRGWENWHDPAHLDRVNERFARSLAAGEVWEDTFPLRGRDGRYRWFLSRAIPIRSPDGRVVRWFGTNTDVTELRIVEEQLVRARDDALRASRAKDEFLAALSHELRTPLSPVLLLASDAADNDAFSPDARELFERIRKNVELEARLIDDLLDLTSISRGKLVLNRQRVPLGDVMADALATVQTEVAAKDITIALDPEPPNPELLADPTRLQQVFWNVLKNAAKFTPARGRITVEIRLADDATRVTVVIKDTGIGMTAAEISRIFDAFSQGDHARSSSPHRFGGLGLGLAISRSIVELHGGWIQAYSAGPNEGAEFSISLPIAPTPGRSPLTPSGNGNQSAKSPADAVAAPLRILLVEDHEPTRAAIAYLLGRRNHAVVTAKSVAEARTRAAEQRCDLLVSDIGLPDGSGHELMRELRASMRLGGIALTGYGMEADVAQALAAGFSVHLTKPVKAAALEAALRQVVEAAGGGAC